MYKDKFKLQKADGEFGDIIRFGGWGGGDKPDSFFHFLLNQPTGRQAQ